MLVGEWERSKVNCKPMVQGCHIDTHTSRMYIHVYYTTGSFKMISSLKGSWKEPAKSVEGRAVMYCGGESDRVSQTLTPSSMIRDKASFRASHKSHILRKPNT